MSYLRFVAPSPRAVGADLARGSAALRNLILTCGSGVLIGGLKAYRDTCDITAHSLSK
jgi:hypothetical protein